MLLNKVSISAHRTQCVERPCRRMSVMRAVASASTGSDASLSSVSRRTLGLSLGALAPALFLSPLPALAARIAPAGYRLHIDKIDGYSFFYPEEWITVTTSGNDVFYRNPRNLDENLFVEVGAAA